MHGVPFRLGEALGSCQAGGVWSAVDHQGRPVTVAVLADGVAGDPEWRAAFAHAASVLQQSWPAGVFSDVVADSPWFACVTDTGARAEQIFGMMGLDFFPVPPGQGPPVPTGDDNGQRPAPAEAVLPWAQPASAGTPTAWPSVPSRDALAIPVEGRESAAPSAETSPVSPAVSSPPAPWQPAPAPVQPSHTPWAPAPPDQQAPAFPPPPDFPPPPAPDRFGPASPPRRRRAVLWSIVAVLVVAVLGVGVGIVVWNGTRGGPGRRPTAAAASGSPALGPAPVASALHPGVEPPAAGGWPTTWPRFKDADRVLTYVAPAQPGFVVRVPQGWKCAPAAQATGYTKYTCGWGSASGSSVGGEFVIRGCPDQCAASTRREMRTQEEAWGLQWIQGGANSTWAESTSVKVDGATRYGLVVVAYIRANTTDGAIDHQLVIRMISTTIAVDQVREVVNLLREELIF